MVDLMSSIICEGDTVSQELLDTVLVNLVPAHKVCAQKNGHALHFYNRIKKTLHSCTRTIHVGVEGALKLN